MDALDRILPLASLLWPVRDCDVSISRDPATGDAAFRARVFDVGLAALPLAEATGDTPAASAEALATHLAALARPQVDALLRAVGGATAATRADLARERDGREDEHADHAAAFRRLAALALRGAAAAMRRTGASR